MHIQALHLTQPAAAQPFSRAWAMAITLLMVVVGGFKRPVGPIVGAIVYFLFKDLLGEYATHSNAIFGAALIAVIVFSPDGIVGAIERAFKGKKAAGAAHQPISH